MFGERNMFQVSKTLNEWLRDFHYEWMPGEERMIKAQITEYEAHDMINDLKMEGAVRKRG
jgi:hypothetical protein